MLHIFFYFVAVVACLVNGQSGPTGVYYYVERYHSSDVVILIKFLSDGKTAEMWLSGNSKKSHLPPTDSSDLTDTDKFPQSKLNIEVSIDDTGVITGLADSWNDSLICGVRRCSKVADLGKATYFPDQDLVRLSFPDPEHHIDVLKAQGRRLGDSFSNIVADGVIRQ